jgi:cell division septation protein DedD
MFRALDDAIAGTDQERDAALDLLQQIVHEGHLGKRANSRPYYIVMGVLFITFLILAGAAGLMATGVIDVPGQAIAAADLTPSATPLPPNPEAVGAQLRIMHTDMTNDATLMLQQMQIASRGQSIDCTLEVANASPFRMPAGLEEDVVEELQPLGEQLNQIQADLSPIVAAYQRSCETQTAIDRQVALSYGDQIVTIQVALRDLIPQVQPLPEVMPTAEPTEVIATATGDATSEAPSAATATEALPSDTPEPTVTPTPAVTEREMQQTLVDMQAIIDDMTSLRGGVTVLVQYWNDVEFTGSTLGCREPVPNIPENIVLSDAMAASAPPVMLEAVENLNLGLNLARQAWEAFTETCARGEAALANVVAQQKVVATTAQAAFNDADRQINDAISELR